MLSFSLCVFSHGLREVNERGYVSQGLREVNERGYVSQGLREANERGYVRCFRVWEKRMREGSEMFYIYIKKRETPVRTLSQFSLKN